MGEVVRETDFDKKAIRHQENIDKIKKDALDLCEEAIAEMIGAAVATHENQSVKISAQLVRNKKGEWKLITKASASINHGKISRMAQIMGGQLSIGGAE